MTLDTFVMSGCGSTGTSAHKSLLKVSASSLSRGSARIASGVLLVVVCLKGKGAIVGVVFLVEDVVLLVVAKVVGLEIS